MAPATCVYGATPPTFWSAGKKEFGFGPTFWSKRKNLVVKRYDQSPAMQRRIEQALARLDEQRAARRQARQAEARAEHARRRQERREAARAKPDRGYKSLPNELRPKYGLPGWQVLLARLEPGTWYTFGQIRRLMHDFGTDSVKAWFRQRCVGRGYVVKAGNPDFDPRKRYGAKTPDRYLYKIDGKAAILAQDWRKALGMVSDTGKEGTAVSGQIRGE